MKLITRSTIALVFLLGLAAPLLAQNPDVAVRINKPARNCFPVTVKNLRPNVVSLSSAEMTIFDQKSCKRVCVAKVAIDKRLVPCATLDFRICCEKPLPRAYICYVRVHQSNGTVNEEWFFQP
jgi:hypothetical protein